MCQYPGCDASAHEVDHIVPQGLGGKSSLCNAQLLCGTHHKQKTAQDVKVMAKADRQGVRSGQQARRKRNGSQIQSRGFDKRYRKKMNGQVERVT